MHALHYTRPREQRYIIRILFMVPVYAISSYLQLQWYWHAIYFQVISDCYEAFAIASFFALLCHYVAPDLHSQKDFFRELRPIKSWVLPVNWFARCCGGQRGIWRTPKSGLTWFNIVWIGVYHYCFIRVVMTISAVVSQYFKRYCESSNSPVFGHIWVCRAANFSILDLTAIQILVFNALAVTVAMYCLIQFYIQLREPLSEYKLFIKIVAIKLVIFLSFWQTAAISVGTSTLKIVHPNKVLAYPDIKVGIPALLLCVEMAIFSILHLWAFPYAPYTSRAPVAFYPVPDADKGTPSVENAREPPQGGFLGIMAFFDALNLWDFIKAFGRGIRWLFCGVKRRKEDVSYRLNDNENLDMDNLPEAKHGVSSYDNMRLGSTPTRPGEGRYSPPDHGDAPYDAHAGPYGGRGGSPPDESVGLMDHAQPNPGAHAYSGSPPRYHQRQESPYGAQYGAGRYQANNPYDDQETGMQPSYDGQIYNSHGGGGRSRPTEAQAQIGQALWGPPGAR